MLAAYQDPGAHGVQGQQSSRLALEDAADSLQDCLCTGFTELLLRPWHLAGIRTHNLLLELIERAYKLLFCAQRLHGPTTRSVVRLWT